MGKEGRSGGSFFPLGRGDLIFLLVFLLLAALGFGLPVLREARFAGVALFGFWMAGLMILVPAVALFRVLREVPEMPEERAEDEGMADP